MAEKFILEFSRNEIELMAALVHLYLSHQEEDEVALSLLQECIEQTNFVYSDGAKHGISKSPLMPLNQTSATRWGQNISGFMDLANLSGIIYYSDDTGA